MTVLQNDPHELLEVLDARGQPTGRAVDRATIHLAGHWHQAFHCWILRRGGAEVVLQRRALTKDTFPGCWDAAAAGHWRYGESAAEAAREIDEELGVSVPFEALVYRGQERMQRRFPNGLTDREFHQVYVLRSDRALGEYRPEPREVCGLAAFPVAGLIAVAAGRAPLVDAVEAVQVAADGTLSPVSVSARRDDLVPYSAARYRRMLGPTRPALIECMGHG
jgi:isopentenyldiphosphate isomerase